MSGGSYDHVQFKLQEREILGDYEKEILNDLRENDAGDIANRLTIIFDELESIGNVIHGLDWYLSGDTSKTSFLEKLNEHRKKYRSPNS